MPEMIADQSLIPRKHSYGSFLDRYPDYLSWLDGNLWALDLETDVAAGGDNVNQFRASLAYQAKNQYLKIRTKVAERNGRQVLLVQAYEREDTE